MPSLPDLRWIRPRSGLILSPMKPTHNLLLVVLACSTLFAETNPHQQLHEALLAEQQGRFDLAIRLTQSVLDSSQLHGVELGRAWIMLGVACEVEGKLNQAQAAFESALRVLKREPEAADDYASALDNYAGVYNDAGQVQLALSLWTKTLALWQELGDHAAVMRSLTNLAGLSLRQRRTRDARRYLERASQEMKLSRNLMADDLAVLCETQAWLALAEGHAAVAIAGYQRALELVHREHGDEHWLTGWEYMLCGKAYAQSGELDRALENMRKGLAILEHALGTNNPKYFIAQIAYSQLLDRAGSHRQAAQLREAAEQASKNFYRGQCPGCTINVAGFR
jgi:tetratricopeptide (TPR) repeat protein